MLKQEKKNNGVYCKVIRYHGIGYFRNNCNSGGWLVMNISPKKIFLAADHHFGHKKLIEGCEEESKFSYRPFSSIEEHDEVLVENHNKVVSPDDEIWFGGDVFLTNHTDISILSRMNGKKKLIVGNHDTHNKIVSYAPYFEKIIGYEEFRKYNIILSHIPVHESQLKRFSANIHGHVHKDTLDDDRYFNISLENINYTPISLDEIISIFKDKGVL